MLIYNGDADSCVPFIGNEQWTSSMATNGVVLEERHVASPSRLLLAQVSFQNP